MVVGTEIFNEILLVTSLVRKLDGRESGIGCILHTTAVVMKL